MRNPPPRAHSRCQVLQAALSAPDDLQQILQPDLEQFVAFLTENVSESQQVMLVSLVEKFEHAIAEEECAVLAWSLLSISLLIALSAGRLCICIWSLT
jgi:hypothetical protein